MWPSDVAEFWSATFINRLRFNVMTGQEESRKESKKWAWTCPGML
jgi:hypothetical protein